MTDGVAQATPRTLLDEIWEAHVVAQAAQAPAVLYVDRTYLHEVTSPSAFATLRRRGLTVRHPRRTVAMIDHVVATDGEPDSDAAARDLCETIDANCREFGVTLHGLGSERRGIVHVAGPEGGMTLPGMTIACSDSHASTHGALGALAFGVGSSGLEQALATQCILQRKPAAFEVRLEGALARGVTAKDLALGLIARMGTEAARGHAVEFTGVAVRGLSIEGRMTLCSMSAETGARTGIIAPDETTFEYLAGREHAPRGPQWQAALSRWRTLQSTPDAPFDQSATFDVSDWEPMVTFGTRPDMGIPVTGVVPDPDAEPDPGERATLRRALDYMSLRPGVAIAGQPVDVVFIGSCTNSRLEDLRGAAQILRGRRVREGVRALIVAGSVAVQRAAEAEGLDEVFRRAGAQWRNPGCSMCVAINADRLQPGQRAVSTSNRNFEGRQGPGGRTFLASPLTAAACAVAGCIADPRDYI